MPQPSSVIWIELETSLGNCHRDPRRARVDGIFQQFLECGGRTLYNLASGDAVYESLWKSANLRHLGTLSITRRIFEANRDKTVPLSTNFLAFIFMKR